MRIDPILLEMFKNKFSSIAEEMGVTLNRTAFSPNIKERRDFSCAVFDRDDNLVAHAAHIPVHLNAVDLRITGSSRALQIPPNPPLRRGGSVQVSPFVRGDLVGFCLIQQHWGTAPAVRPCSFHGVLRVTLGIEGSRGG
jgi:hypothetical protein